MALNFPSSPTVGALYPNPVVAGVPQYRWDGQAWLAGVFDDPAQYVKKTGDTMTGGLIIAPASGNPTLHLAHIGSGTTNNDIVGSVNGSPRWLIRPGNAGAETGGNAGSDFVVTPHDDTGATTLGTALFITRSTGLIKVKGDPTEPTGVATKQSSEAAAALRVAKTGDTMSGALNVTTTGAIEVPAIIANHRGNTIRLNDTNALYYGSMGFLSVGAYQFFGFFAEHSTTAGALKNSGVGTYGAAFVHRLASFNLEINGVNTGGSDFSAVKTALSVVTASGQVSVPTNISSTSTTTGALVVTGGVGIGGELNVGQLATFKASARIEGLGSFGGSVGIGGEFFVNGGVFIIQSYNRTAPAYTPITFSSSAYNFSSTGNVVIQSATASTSTTTGALVVTGGVGIGGVLTVGNGADTTTLSAFTALMVTNAGLTNVSIRNSVNDTELLNFADTAQGVIGTFTNHPLKIRSNNADRITVAADGTVSIGGVLNVGGSPIGLLRGGVALNVNMNAVGDTAITITSPTTKYRIVNVLIENVGTTASLTTAQYAIYTAAGGGGAVIGAPIGLTTITSNAANTVGNSHLVGAPASNQLAQIVLSSVATIYFRCTTAQGAAATVNVYVFIEPLA